MNESGNFQFKWNRIGLKETLCKLTRNLFINVQGEIKVLIDCLICCASSLKDYQILNIALLIDIEKILNKISPKIEIH
jgi:hypothetical protein